MQSGFFAADELWLWLDCIHPDTNIITHDSIEKADSNVLFKNPLCSMDGENIVNSVSVAQIKKETLPMEELVYVSTRTRDITTSKSHRFFCLGSDTNYWKKHDDLDEITEKMAEDLREGDRVLIAHKISEPKCELIDRKLARLVGYILADGHIDYPFRSSIHIEDGSIDTILKYEALARECGFTTTTRKHKEANCYRLVLFGKEHIEKLLGCLKDISAITGKKALSTSLNGVPHVISGSNNAVLSEFIGGFFDGDGHVKMETYLPKKYTLIQFTNANRVILEKIKYLLLRFGIDCSKIKKQYDKKKNCTWYNISIKDSMSVKLFKENIVLFNQDKASKIVVYPYRSKRRIFGDIEVGFVTEAKKVLCDVPYLVDFAVPAYENYVANGFIVHNSWQNKSKKVGMVSSILLKSRKRSLTMAFTTQGIGQVVKRIRDVVDFVAYPIMSPDGRACKVIIMRGGSTRPTPINQPPLYFNCESVYAMYDTREEIQPIEDIDKAVFKEQFLNIYENKTFINDYLIDQLHFNDEDRIRKFCDAIQAAINPDNIRSEKDRKDNKEVMSAI
jgi:hypothetical protein